MEKKTIGKFISVLRKANGMTQQELADKLLVSDKTVSKWERDERMPDISLLPAIAEIFGITTDELLRGERKNPERAGYGTEESETKQKAKSDKQLKLMIDKKVRTYNALTCISAFLVIIGLILAVTLYDLGTILSVVFLMCAQACQIVFAVLSVVRADEEDGRFDGIGRANTHIIKVATTFTIINLSMVVFCCLFNSAVDVAFMLILPTIAVLYSIYALAVRKHLYKCGLMTMSATEEKVYARNSKLFKRMLVICGSIAVIGSVVGFCVIEYAVDFLQPNSEFISVESFKSYVEGECDAWIEENYNPEDWMFDNGNGYLEFDHEGFQAYYSENIKEDALLDENFKVLCGYRCLKNKYAEIKAVTDKDGNITVQLFTDQDIREAYINKDVALQNLGFAVGLMYFGVVIALYIVLANVNKKKVLAGAYDADKAEEAVQEEIVAE